MTPKNLEISALPGIPLVAPGDDLVRLILEAMARTDRTFAQGDIVIVAQKLVSKAENRYATLDSITPSRRAITLAARVDKDPRLVEVILSESDEVVAAAPGVLVVAHRSGHVMANAGVDRSNLGAAAGEEQVLLLPVDPDGEAARLRAGLERLAGVAPAVVISDSIGRPWRNGTAAVAIG